MISNKNVDWITEDTLENYLLDGEVTVEDLPSDEPMGRDGDYYDGNPPYSVEEQEERNVWAFITVWNRGRNTDFL